MNNAISEFAEALHLAHQCTEALNNCNQVIQDLFNKEAAEAKAQSMAVGIVSDYVTEDVHSYAEDGRSNGSQPAEKKMRRGVSPRVGQNVE